MGATEAVCRHTVLTTPPQGRDEEAGPGEVKVAQGQIPGIQDRRKLEGFGVQQSNSSAPSLTSYVIQVPQLPVSLSFPIYKLGLLLWDSRSK